MISSDKSIESKISDWLETQGYPLEMLVAREFQRSGFRVFQSEYYTDPETGISREIDILAYIQQQVANVLFRVSFWIECKTSHDKPWLLFTSENVKLASPARVVQRAASTLGDAFLHRLSHSTDIQSLKLLSLPQRSGYGMTQAFTTGKDIPYEAAVGVAKCVAAKAVAADQINERQVPFCEILFPAVVINSKLFECYLDHENNVVIQEIKTGVLVWRNPLVKKPHTIVRISTIQELPAFIKDAQETVSNFIKQEETMLSILEEIKDRREKQAQTLLIQGKTKRR